MRFSVTERQDFKRCRRMWDYKSKNRQHLTKLIPSSALDLGIMVHQALAEWMQSGGNLKQLFTDIASKNQDTIREGYKAAIGAYPSDNEMSKFYDSVELGIAMMENYQAFYKRPIPKGWTLIAPEQEIHIQIPDTDMELEGRIDAILKDPEGIIYPMDHKTYSQQPRPEVIQSDDQFLAYLWIVRQLGLGPVKGLCYNGMLKVQSPGRNKTLADLFHREILIRPEQEFDEFTDFIFFEANDVAMAYNNPSALYTNRIWKGCFDCDYDTLCKAQSRGEDVEYIKTHMYKYGGSNETD